MQPKHEQIACLLALALLSACGPTEATASLPPSSENGGSGSLETGGVTSSGAQGGVTGSGGFTSPGGATSPGGFTSSGGFTAAGGFTSPGGFTASGGDTGGGGASTCSLTFTFTTVSNGGEYAPDNVSAVWVTNPSSAFVRTLEENGRIRQKHLTAWEQASGGSTVDAVTGATNRSFGTHTVHWDCTDLGGAAVPGGTYTLSAEYADSNFSFGGNPLLSVPVPIGSGPQSIHPPDAQYFTNVSVVVQ